MSTLALKFKSFIFYQRLWGAYPVEFSGDKIIPSKVFRILFVVAAVCLIFFSVFFDYDTSDDDVLLSVAESVAAAAVIGISSSWIILSLKTDKICAMYTNFDKIDNIMEKNNVKINLKWQVIGAWIWNTLILGATLSILVLEIFWPLWVTSGYMRFLLAELYFAVLFQLMGNMAFLVMAATYRFCIINGELVQLRYTLKSAPHIQQVNYGKVKTVFLCSASIRRKLH